MRKEAIGWVLAAWACTWVCHAQQNFPSPGIPAAQAQPAPSRDAGFQPPETVLPAPRTSPVASVSLGTHPLLTTARAHFAQAHAVTDLRVAGAAPFRLHAIFSAMGDAELANGGTYAEIWHSPVQWRREAICGQVHILETRDGDALYRKITGSAYAPRRIDDLLDALDRTLPKLDDSFLETDWQQGDVLYAGFSVLRLAHDYDATPLPSDARAYWIDPDGKVRAGYEANVTIEYADYADFNGKQVARHLYVKQNGKTIAGIWIDDLAAIASDTGTQFTIAGVTPYPMSDSAPYSGAYFVPPHPVHQVTPSDPPPGQGRVVIAVHLDRHGHIRSAKVQQGVNADLDAAALQAALEWEFSPALQKGRPVASDAVVQFTF